MTFAKEALFGICLALALAWAWPAQARVNSGAVECGSLQENAGVDSGPYDYRTAPPEKRRLAEKSNFQSLAAPSRERQSRERIAADLDSLLHLFPNHPQALMAMAELARQEKTDHPRGSRYSMGCWYERAVRFAPGDVQVRVAYGYWLAKKGDRAAAIEQLDRVSAEALESEILSYNLGLAYCETQDYDKALRAAHRAYALGHALPGLRNRLISAGKWREPGAGKMPITPVNSKAGG